MAQANKKPRKTPKYKRLTIWEAEKKFDTAIRALSTSVQQTREVQDVFKGFKVPVGQPFYHNNKRWQFQVSAYCTKDMIIKKNEVVPILAKLAIGIRLRSIAKYIVDWANKS